LNGKFIFCAILQPEENKKVKPAWQILVVDDEPSICKILKMLLEKDGHKVQTANSGGEALVLLEQDDFDLVTTDFSMLGMKGDTLAATIKQHRPKLPVLMISANAVIAKSFGNPLVGVDLVISKPFVVEELREAIDKLLPGI
jgi:CheY-like chemotaxis protein